jgi:ketosteroid isomerase-like protein
MPWHEGAMRIDPVLLIPFLLVAGPVSVTISTPSTAHQANHDPAAAYAELMAAERAFSAQAANRTPAEGIAAMFDAEVQLPTRDGIANGREAATAALAANPSSRGTGASWRSIGGGVSADGSQGFTYGYLDIAGGDPARAHRRYLAYWVKRPEGWRVLAMRQLVRQPSEAEIGPIAPLVPATTAAGGRADHARAVAAAERAFSDRAQQVGLRAAFMEYGHARAVHVATPNGFAVGLPAIGVNFDAATTSPLNWSSDRTWAAASGDLGLSVGTIRRNGPAPEGQPSSIPFFTIWIRDSATGQWRYIAE